MLLCKLFLYPWSKALLMLWGASHPESSLEPPGRPALAARNLHSKHMLSAYAPPLGLRLSPHCPHPHPPGGHCPSSPSTPPHLNFGESRGGVQVRSLPPPHVPPPGGDMEVYELPCGNSSPLGALSGFGKGIPRHTVKIGRVGSRVYWQRRQRGGLLGPSPGMGACGQRWRSSRAPARGRRAGRSGRS